MAIIRKAGKEEYEEIMKLGEAAFNYRLTEEQKEDRRWQMDKQDILAVFEDEKLAAKLHLLPLEVYLGEKRVRMGGIAGVATYPEYRRAGYVSQMIKDSLSIMKDKGISLSLLHPFSVPFYRKFGYELTQYTHTYQSSPSDLLSEKYQAKGKLKRKTYQEARDELNHLYEKAASQYTLMLVRKDWWWTRRVIDSESVIILHYDNIGDPAGYIISTMKSDKLVIEEFIYHSADAFYSLLQWVKNHDSMTNQVEMMLLPNNLDAIYFENPGIKEMKKAYFMARIVDVETFFKEYPFYSAEESFDLRLHIRDEQAGWNDGTWVWRVNGGKAVEVRKVNGFNQADIYTDIQSLTAIMCGNMDVKSAVFMERMKGDAEKITAFEKTIRPQTAAFLDFF
ncbi:GNAT family N-acetyltransferase [Thalassobacillus pellis]|uniref:GNAT family N-acetyltransferase n=1 Tax=Thalassobacillus pellis TaxID=748008 RepID=UPI00195FDF7A|nr:GNAT family N-acetyltransferase [Thalassobacillus pellis]MBM7552885.1 putative acetyltransferase [Thalassobacillus pellis]